MKLIERVYYSLIGMKIKSLLLLLVISILGAFLSASFSIYQANKSLEKIIHEQVNPILLIDWNHHNDKGIFTFDNEKQIKEIIDKLKENNKVNYIENRYHLDLSIYNYQINLFLKNENLEPYHYYEGKTTIVDGKKITYFELIGIDSYSLSDLDNGNFNLIYGETFTKEEIDNGENVFLFITEFEPMEHYLQRLIDTKFHYLSFEKIKFFDYTYENINEYEKADYNNIFKLKGILEKTYEFPTDLKYHVVSYIGKLIVPFNTVKKLSDEFITYVKQYEDKYPFLKNNQYLNSGQLYYTTDSYIQIQDIKDLDSFIRGLKDEYGDYIENIYSFSDSYNDVKNIIRNLNFIAIISLVTCSIASIVLLSLIIQVLVNERRYEIGVYLSMGEKRINIIKQIVLEVLIIGLLGISLSLFAGNMIARSFSNDLLERQIAQIEVEKDEFGLENSYAIDEEEIENAYQVAITGEYIISVYTGGMLVLLISCVIPMKSIMKMKVKKMLL